MRGQPFLYRRDLNVDDEPDIRDMLSSYFRKCGYEVLLEATKKPTPTSVWACTSADCCAKNTAEP